MVRGDAAFLREKAKTCRKPSGGTYGVATLRKVLNRGYGAYRTSPGSVRNTRGVKGGPGPKMSPQQWARARVNSFCRGSRKHDRDLR
jgi:hypothetical protein